MWKEIPAVGRGVVYHVDAPSIGDTLKITIIAPFPHATAPGNKFSALYVLDSAFTLDVVVGTKRLYDIFSGGAVPPTYIIGIGYADPDVGARRFRDFTPTDAPLPTGLTHSVALGLGGAFQYLEFLTNEVIPKLEANHPLDPGQRGLIGYSLSGLFAAYVLFQRPESFERYLIISPSLWWDDALILKKEQEWAHSHADLRAKVFMTMGDAEEQPGGGWRNNLPDKVGLPLKQVTRFHELCTNLRSRNFPGLSMRTALMPDGRHITVFPAAVGLGLTELFQL